MLSRFEEVPDSSRWEAGISKTVQFLVDFIEVDFRENPIQYRKLSTHVRNVSECLLLRMRGIFDNACGIPYKCNTERSDLLD